MGKKVKKSSKANRSNSNQEKKVRIDQLLLEKGLAADLKEAQALIMAGKVLGNEQKILKPSEMLENSSKLRLLGRSKFVSRGGEKLEGAIKAFGLEDAFKDQVALDIGASTGGFTHCLLQYGAKTVIALDVGSNQLAWSLRSHPQVISLEKTDIKVFDCDRFPALDWVVADISFNGLGRLAPYIVRAGGKRTQFLLMVKPQFELSAADVPKGGVVIDEKKRQIAISSVEKSFQKEGLRLQGVEDSIVLGRTGNKEAFLYFGPED